MHFHHLLPRLTVKLLVSPILEAHRVTTKVTDRRTETRDLCIKLGVRAWACIGSSWSQINETMCRRSDMPQTGSIQGRDLGGTLSASLMLGKPVFADPSPARVMIASFLGALVVRSHSDPAAEP